jgi:hypothetical protein
MAACLNAMVLGHKIIPYGRFGSSAHVSPLLSRSLVHAIGVPGFVVKFFNDYAKSALAVA